MAVTVLEALATGSRASGASRVHLVGAFPSVVDWALPAYVNAPLEVSKFPGDARGLGSAVREATDAAGSPSTLVLTVDPNALQGGLAVALRFGPDPGPRAPEWELPTGAEGAAALACASLAKLGVFADRSPGEVPPPASWTPDRLASFTSVGLSQVSEGAYVPRPRYLENLPSRWRLEGDQCARCERVTFPRRARCRYCGQAGRLSPVNLPRDGARVVAATIIGPGSQPTEFDPQVEALGGYGVVLAEFAPGVRLTLQVTDAGPGQVRIGDRIGTRLRRLYPMEGEWRYGRKAVPMPT